MVKAGRPGPLIERRGRARKRALVVDGDVLSRIDMRLHLELQGYQVEEVSDGLEAIGLVDLDAPQLDLVVLDLDMRLLSGMETLQSLRAMLPLIKAILCVRSDRELQEEAPIEGAVFLVKPSTPRVLALALDKLFGFPRRGKALGSHRMRLERQLPHFPPR